MKHKGLLLLNRQNFMAALTFAVLAVLGRQPAVYAHSQNGETNPGGNRVLERVKGWNPPVAITLVKSRAGVVELDKKFSAGEDWFKGLAISVRNNSEKPITYISLHLNFPHPRGQESELDYGYTLQYGVNPIRMAQKRLPLPPAAPIPPGEEVEVMLSDMKYDHIRASLMELKYPSRIESLRVAVEMLGFSDGAIWLGNQMFKQDRNEPGMLILLEEKPF